MKEKQEESRSWPLTHSEVLRLLASAARGWRDDNALRLGAALSFYSLVSFPPLIIVTISIAALIFGREAAQAGLLRQVAQLLGKSGSEMFEQMMKAASRPGHGLVAASIGLVFVLFGATGVFAELRDALNLIWKVQSTDKNVVRGLLKGRLLALNLVIGTGFLLIVSLVVSAALSALSASVGSHLKGFDQVLQGLDLVVSFGVLALLFALIFKILPDVDLAWRDVALGAAVTSLLFTAGKFAIGAYLGTATVATAYGAAGSLVLLLLWVYYSSQIFFFGAELTRSYAERRGRGKLPAATQGAVPVTTVVKPTAPASRLS
ncbi:MAG TPA: YihY/virulence factor BrkB family protein [Thermoanaerobaculia bacterium]|nr:YihY/virulence factor BrkB family protein [Thermoanaerobaculia bacterium]